MFDRLAAHWVYGAALFAPILLIMTPLFGFEGTTLWAFVTLPIDMLHQYEEHDADRFRTFVNGFLGEDRVGLSPSDVLIINVVGVWMVTACVVGLCVLVHPGWAVTAAYLLAVNAIAHIGQGVALRRYNPGLGTSVLLFLPLAALIFWSAGSVATLGQHLAALVLVVGLHALIAVRAMRPVGSSR